jgi:hypothetical protein
MADNYRENARTFLDLIFREKSDEHHMLIWCAPSKASKFFVSTQEAADYAVSLIDKQNVYYGVGLHREPKSKGRGGTDDIIGIPAIWIDIDIQDEAHQKKNLPPSIDDAMGILEGLRWPPSMLIHSGHGLQAHWLLREILDTSTEDARIQAKLLVQRFQAYVRSLFLKKGWTLDSVHDLARVMRMPGTMNMKTEPHVPARILFVDDHVSYNTSDFDDLPEMQDETVKNQSQITVDMDGVLLDPHANPPVEKLEVLKTNDPDFERSWDHTRKDFPSGDYSQSAYDQSLASKACLWGWSDQEIVNLVIANRRRFSADLKLRRDYFRKLLANAKVATEKMKALHDIESGQLVGESEMSAPEGSVHLSREKCEEIWERYSQLWGLKIFEVQRTMYDPPTYRMRTAAGWIEIGSSANIYNYKAFRSLVGDRAKLTIPEDRPRKWLMHASTLIASAQDEHPGDEATDIGFVTGLLQQYFKLHAPCPEDDEKYISEIESELPFWKGEHIYIFMNDLQSWSASRRNVEPLKRNRLSHLLRLLGISPETVRVTGPKKSFTPYAWLIPPTLNASLLSGVAPPETHERQPVQLIQDGLPDEVDF